MDKKEVSVEVKRIDLAFGGLKVLRDLDLEIYRGEFLVLLGSSGCGKSTLLNCIAGLLEVSDGQIFINGKNVTWMEPAKRGIGMVFQSYALYPQMSVRKNLSFGLRNARVPREEIDKRVNRAAEMLRIEALLDRKPAALSDGQRQRVAIGRALVRDVDVFLFDEPLSNLDAKLRIDLRVEIKKLHQRLKNTMIYVTHDQVEAMTLADRIAVMKGGKIMQLGGPDRIYNYPQNRYVADFIGSPSMNFFEGGLENGGFKLDDAKLSLKGYEFGKDAKSSGPAVLGIRPEHISTGDKAAKAAIRHKAKVNLVEPMGSDTLVYADMFGENVRIRMDGYSKVRAGDELVAGFDPALVSVFDKETGLRI